MIGDGLQSRVYLASLDTSYLHSKNNENERRIETIAVKVIEKEDLKYLGLREFKTLKEIEGHPNIIQAFSYFSGGNLIPNNSP